MQYLLYFCFILSYCTSEADVLLQIILKHFVCITYCGCKHIYLFSTQPSLLLIKEPKRLSYFHTMKPTHDLCCSHIFAHRCPLQLAYTRAMSLTWHIKTFVSCSIFKVNVQRPVTVRGDFFLMLQNVIMHILKELITGE